MSVFTFTATINFVLSDFLPTVSMSDHSSGFVSLCCSLNYQPVKADGQPS